MRRRTARMGRGVTTRPARSPIANEPGRASRSSATAALIVAGMPIATMCRASPSAPQSQSLTPRATITAAPQPTDAATSADPHPRRMPRSRNDRFVTTIASPIPMTTRPATPIAEATIAPLTGPLARSRRTPHAGRRLGATQRQAARAIVHRGDQRRARLERERLVEGDGRRRVDGVVELEPVGDARLAGDVRAHGDDAGRELLGTLEAPPARFVARDLQ